MFFPTKDWGAICPKTGRRFNFSETFWAKRETLPPGIPLTQSGYYGNQADKKDVRVELETTIRFPNGNPSVLEVVCPYCEDHAYHSFKYDEMSRPATVADLETKEREDELKIAMVYDKDHEKIEKELRKEIDALKTKLEKERETNQKMLHEKDMLLNKSLGNLTESYMSLARFVHEDLPKMLQGQLPTKTKSYETANT